MMPDGSITSRGCSSGWGCLIVLAVIQMQALSGQLTRPDERSRPYMARPPLIRELPSHQGRMVSACSRPSGGTGAEEAPPVKLKGD